MEISRIYRSDGLGAGRMEHIFRMPAFAAPAILFSNLEDGEGAPDLVRLLRNGFFDGFLPCAHKILPIPYEFYRDSRRILHCLW
jgi:hypothetical protein